MLHYVAIDRKPESACEIQNSACGNSVILLRLLIVKGAGNIAIPSWSDDLPHGTNVLCYLVEPWFGSGRGVCADSYFSSVIAAKTLVKNGLKYFGVVKTACRQFPMRYLSTKYV